MRDRSASGPADTLVVDGLRVEYGGRGWWPGRPGRTFRAVDDVSFSVEPGEIFGLVGESGCGKTTVANTIAGLIRPDAGTVRLGGEPIGTQAARACAAPCRWSSRIRIRPSIRGSG